MTLAIDEWEDRITALWDRFDAYEQALGLGLVEARHAQLAVQYGSTLRNLGRLDEAISILESAPVHESTG